MSSAWQWGSERDRHVALVALVAALVAALALLLWVTNNGTLAIDEWYFGYLYRGGHSASDFFAPHNGHLVLVPVLITKSMLQLFGVAGAVELRLIAIGVHLATVCLLYTLLRQVLSPFTALLPCILFLFLGAAHNAIVGSQGMPLTLSVATGLGAWLALMKRTTAWDTAAALLLTVGVCSNGYALPFTAGAIVLLLLDRDSPWSRLWVAAVPLVIFGTWYLVEGRGEGQFALANVAGLPAYAFSSLGAALAAMTGLFTSPGVRGLSFDISTAQALAGASLVALLALAVGWRYRPPRAAIVPLVALLTFWLLTAGAADPDRLPNASRFLYTDVCLLLLVLAQMIAASRVRREGAIALAAICAFALLPNIREITYGADVFREQSDINRAVLGAADLIEGHVPGSTLVENELEPNWGNATDLGFPIDTYVLAKDRFGTPAFSAAEIYASRPQARAAADRLIVRALPIETAAATRPPRPLPPRLDAEQAGGELTRPRGCLRFQPLDYGAVLNMRLPVGGLWMRPRSGPPVPVAVRHFAEAFETNISPALGGQPSTVGLPPGPASRDWFVQVTPSQPLVICAA